ncbi:MAG TPA: TonB-dependent receptor [Chitinophagaceae bacterium]|nr:TonB-dependent receptor [Chitinophagaceae bacterium]
MKKRLFAVAAVLTGSYLQAQQSPDSTARTLDEVVITANKYPQKQRETGKVLTVITRQQLEQSGGRTLGEILNTVAGTTILGANNSPGTNLTASIRGASAGNTLILVDGLPVTDPSVNNNYFDLNLIDLSQVERIEILKGGQSTLYGSDAVAGVINIITRKASPGGFHADASLTAGSYQSFRQTVGLRGGSSRFAYSLQYAHYGTAGFSAATDSSGSGQFDRDGMHEHAAGGQTQWQVTKRVQLKVMGRYSYYRAGLDAGAFTDDRDYRADNRDLQTGTSLVYTYPLGSLHVNYLFHYVSRDYLDDSGYVANPYASYSRSSYIGRTQFGEAYANWRLNHWELLGGADYRYTNTFQTYFSTGSFGPYAPPDLRAGLWQLSPYGSLVYHDGGLSLEAGGRWNHHSTYGDNFTYTFSPSYLAGKRFKIFLNLYSAYKTPTLYQLYDPSIGNAALRPEVSSVSEGGIEYFGSGGWRVRAVGFYRDSRHTIQYILTDPATYQAQYRNISRQQNHGMELEASWHQGSWQVTGNYTYTDGKTRSPYDGTGFPLGKDTTYYNLYRIPRHAYNLMVGWQALRQVYLSTQLHAVSRRDEFVYGSAPVVLDGYYTLDLYLEYRPSKHWRLFTDLRNLTDQRYVDFLGYNTRRFNADLGITFHW